LYDPPAAYDDCQSDADDAPTPPDHPYREIEVEGVGLIHARKPLPNAIPALAGAANSKSTGQGRVDQLDIFVQAHLAPGEFEGLLARMMDPDVELPEDTMLRVSRAIATAGTARPYSAVIQLALMAAHNWRALRVKYAGNGIGSLMALPSMHVVLDMIEQLGSEAAATDAKNATEARAKITSYFDKLYKPDATMIKVDGKLPPPPGFSDEEVEASFDAFLNAR